MRMQLIETHYYFIVLYLLFICFIDSDKLWLSITADDVINDLFIDGVSYTSSVTAGNTWGNVRTFEIPLDSQVIAVNCSDTARVRYGYDSATLYDDKTYNTDC